MPLQRCDNLNTIPTLQENINHGNVPLMRRITQPLRGLVLGVGNTDDFGTDQFM